MIRLSTRAGELRLDNVMQKSLEREEKYETLLETVQQLLERNWDLTKNQKVR